MGAERTGGGKVAFNSRPIPGLPPERRKGLVRRGIGMQDRIWLGRRGAFPGFLHHLELRLRTSEVRGGLRAQGREACRGCARCGVP